MSTGIIYNIGVETNIQDAFKGINSSLDALAKSANNVGGGVKKITNSLLEFNQFSHIFDNFKNTLNGVLSPGIALNSSMSDLSAINGVTGAKLKEIEGNARATAKAFGVDAATSVESYKLILSKLGPDVANSSEALKIMGEHVAVLSKTMGNDSMEATEVLTTAMNQFGIDLSDPISASRTMGEMMNTMAAAAKEGSAELPQIKAALEQAGMMAKSSGVSFEELNSAIQVLDKAGKKGAEGGVAIRNMLAEFSMGRFTTKEVKENLEAYGISVEKLNDKHIGLSDKLRMLYPLQKDTALLTKMFGKENEAAALALIENVATLEEYTGRISGTNTAVEQANVVMGSYAEKSNRIKAVFDDLKISFFNATSAAMPYISSIGGGVVDAGMFAGGLFNISNALTKIEWGKMIKGIKDWNLWTKISSGFTAVWGAITSGTIFTGIIPVLKALGVAIMNIPIVGWIAAIVVGLIALGAYLWDTWKPFRATLYGIWEAAKTVFRNIGQFFVNVWEFVIKPVFGFLWEIVKKVFGFWKAVFVGIYEVVKYVVVGIGDFFVWLWDGIVGGIKYVWDILSSVFGGVGGFFNEWIINPIAKAFNWVWEFVSGIFGSIWDGITSLFKPIIALWEKIFGTGMKDVKASFEVGYKKGEEDFDKDHKKEDRKEDKKEGVNNKKKKDWI